MRLFRKWDNVHSLRLLDASFSEAQYRCGLFAVYKNSEKDLQILNPIPENGRSVCMNASTLSLSHGSLLCNVYLGPGQDLVIGADDLEDFYHCFLVSPEHAHRNHVHGVFFADIFKGWNCWDESLSGRKVVGCFSTLAMGNGFAVELAQHTHSNLLRRCGSLKEEQWVQYRKPLPPGDILQLLCIDDYAVLSKVPKGMPATSLDVHRTDHELLGKANEAYERVGLRSSKKKTVRDSFHSVILGAEIDGRRGLIMAPRLRILALCRLTLRLARLRFATKHLLETIVGSWVFILLFRRPLLCILNDLFHEGEKVKNRHEIFPLSLSTGAIHELLLLCIWAPFAYTNMRAEPLDDIFSTDASLSGAGVCRASVGSAATLELCSVSEQKGFYTRIDTSTLGTFSALHSDTFGCDNPLNQDLKVPPPLIEGFLWDFAEVFRGSGSLTKAHQKVGLRVHRGFDMADGDTGDFLHPATFLAIIGLICRRVKLLGAFSCWVAAELDLAVTEETMPPASMNLALIGYGKCLFYAGYPKYYFAETINAAIDHFPGYRGLIGAAWQTLKKWEEAEPVERSMVMPAAVLQAGISLALLWEWLCFAAALLLGFRALLRPAEFLGLKRSDLVLPRDVLADEAICYVRVLHSKTSRFMLRQHARISDKLTVHFLDALFGGFPHDQLLFGCSAAAFRSRWNRLCGHLNIPTSEKARGITPKSLRGSGASWLFHHTEDVERTLWRGHWQSKRTLEHYLQDVMGQTLLVDLCQEKHGKT
eukprot:s910_g26.t1